MLKHQTRNRGNPEKPNTVRLKPLAHRKPANPPFYNVSAKNFPQNPRRKITKHTCTPHLPVQSYTYLDPSNPESHIPKTLQGTHPGNSETYPTPLEHHQHSSLYPKPRKFGTSKTQQAYQAFKTHSNLPQASRNLSDPSLLETYK